MQGCPFSGNMPLGIPKKRVKSKKAFHFSSKKRSARVTCDCSAKKHQTAAAGRVLRVQGCPFSGKMPLGIPKKRVKPKKAFHFSSKKRSAPKEARQRRVREAVLRVQGCPFFYSMSTASHRCMESPTPHSACVLCIWMQKWLLSSVPSSMNLPNVTMTF